MDHNYPEVRIAELSSIRHSYHLVPRSEKNRWPTLLIRYVGSYGIGCEGNEDAAYMSAVAVAGLEARSPAALVLDFRELGYEWGDMMTQVLSVGRGHVNVIHEVFGERKSGQRQGSLPTAVIVSERCRAALTSLLEAEMREDPAKWLFDSLDMAFASFPQ